MNRKIIIPLIVIVVIAVAVVGLLTRPKSKPSTAQTDSSTQSQNPATQIKAVSGPEQPVFFGLDNVLNTGVTDNQLSAFKFALTKYAKALGGKQTITVDSATAEPKTPESDNPDVTDVTVVINGANYTGTITSADLTSMTLVLKDSRGALVFNSGLVDLYKGIGD